MTEQVVLLGSGDLYLASINDVVNATEAEITNALVKVGEIQGEATLKYSPEFHEVRGGATNGVIANFLTKEDVTFSSGVLTWDLQNMEKLTAAYYSEDTTNNTKRIGIGGKGSVPVNYLRFVHKKVQDGKNLTVNIFKAQNQNGFDLKFNPEKETVIDTEFKALAVLDKKDGTLVEIIEEVDQILVPTVTDVNPVAILQADLPQIITVDGTNFDSTSVVLLETSGTQTSLDTTYVSNTQLTAQIPSGTAMATYTVKVKTGYQVSATGIDITIN